jgi:hypothetical protein
MLRNRLFSGFCALALLASCTPTINWRVVDHTTNTPPISIAQPNGTATVYGSDNFEVDLVVTDRFGIEAVDMSGNIEELQCGYVTHHSNGRTGVVSTTVKVGSPVNRTLPAPTTNSSGASMTFNDSGIFLCPTSYPGVEWPGQVISGSIVIKGSAKDRLTQREGSGTLTVKLKQNP